MKDYLQSMNPRRGDEYDHAGRLAAQLDEFGLAVPGIPVLGCACENCLELLSNSNSGMMNLVHIAFLNVLLQDSPREVVDVAIRLWADGWASPLADLKATAERLAS